MNKIKQICLSIIIGISVFGVLGLLLLFFFDIPKTIIHIISTLVGITGTVFSVILSIAAMCYSNKSSKNAEVSLKKITNHYGTLCKELATQEICKNLGKHSVDTVIEHSQKNLGKDKKNWIKIFM